MEVRRSSKRLLVFIITITTVVISGCGGGSSSAANTTPTASTAIIDSSNALLIARQAYLTSDATKNASNGFLALLASPLPQGMSTPNGILYTIPCPGGGTIVLESATDIDGVFDQGEVFNTSATNCIDSSGLSSSGQVSITITSKPTPTTYTLDLNFQTYTITEGSQTAALQGEITLAIDLIAGTVLITNNTLNYTTFGVLSQLNNMNNMITTVPNTTTSTVSYGATLLTILTLNKPLTISTPTPFVFQLPNKIPTSGSIRVTASDGTFTEINSDNGNPATVTFTISTGSTVISNEIPWTSILI